MFWAFQRMLHQNNRIIKSILNINNNQSSITLIKIKKLFKIHDPSVIYDTY